MTKRYAVIGDPVNHSLSPLMHSGWIEDHGLDAVYEAHHLRSDDPVRAIRVLEGYDGVNVTVPHKEAAASAAERASAAVRQLNAANTLTWRDGILFGDNTDAPGFTLALEEAAPDWHEVKTALVIGAGGAGRAVAYGLAGQDGPAITIVNRTFERADAAARMIGPHCGRTAIARPWSALAESIAEADIIVNATTLGMNGARFDWPMEHARAGALVADIVYRPLETPLLRQARARGLKTVDGLSMLIRQGALSFEIWHGIKPDAARARERLMAGLA